MYTTYIKPLRSPLESAIKEKIKQSKAVTPKEYCEKWIPKKTQYEPSKRGYISACVRELSEVLGYAEISIRKWGKDFENHPDTVKVTLTKQDQLNSINEILRSERGNII
jgi:hypothetical protein